MCLLLLVDVVNGHYCRRMVEWSQRHKPTSWHQATSIQLIVQDPSSKALLFIRPQQDTVAQSIIGKGCTHSLIHECMNARDWSDHMN